MIFRYIEVLTKLIILPGLLCVFVLMPGGASGAEHESQLIASNESSLEMLGRWHGGPVYASAVSNDYVYFGSGGSIRILEIRKNGLAASPQWVEISRYDTPGVVRDLEINGDFLFVADDGGALRVVDVSNPAEPFETSKVDLPPFVRAVSLEGERAYLATGWNGMVIIDIGEPDNPRIINTVKNIGYLLDVHVENNRALVADSKSGIKLFDVSNPESPVQIGSSEVPGRSHGVHLEKNLAYVVSLETFDEKQVGGLSIVDFSSLENPKLVGFEPLTYGAERVWVEQSKAYLAGVVTDAGLIIVDVTNPSAPERLGAYTHPTCSESIAVRNGVAYLSHGDQGLKVIDLSEPLRPTVSKNIETAGHVRGVHVVDSLAFVANGYTGIRIFDVSDPSNITQVAHHKTYRALDIKVQSSYAYVADDSAGLEIVDVSDPRNPFAISYMDTPGYAEAISVAGDRAFIASGNGGLRVVDISNPYEPIEVASMESRGYAYDILDQKGIVYMADGKSGLRVFLASRSAPVEIANYKPAHENFEIFGVDVSGHFAFVAAGYAGFRVLDISNIRAPLEVAKVEILNQARSVEVQGNIAFVGDRKGLTALDISNPRNPEVLSYYPMPAHADRIWIANSQVYVAAREAGLMVFDLAQPSK